MRISLFLAALLCLISCPKKSKLSIDRNEKLGTGNQIVKPEFRSIIDSADVLGSILLYDLQKDTYYSNDFEWANEGKLPASTFKIANSIIGLETGVIESDSVIFKWDGQPKGNKNWEQDLILRDAFHFSCVPCYQGVARKIGAGRMNRYLDALKYGKIQVDSNSIDSFWLRGDSRISQMQQIDFLRRFHNAELPISERTERIMKNVIIIKETETYRLSGKSGLSNENKYYNGWFVGYIEIDTNTYFFATNIEPKGRFDFDTFIKKRMEVTFEALRQIAILPQNYPGP